MATVQAWPSAPTPSLYFQVGIITTLGSTCLLMCRRCPLAFFSIPNLSSSFFLREATACSFLSSPVFLALLRPSCRTPCPAC